MNKKMFRTVLGAILLFAVVHSGYKTSNSEGLIRSSKIDLNFSTDVEPMNNLGTRKSSLAPVEEIPNANKVGTKEPDVLDKVINAAQTASVYYNEFVKQNGSITEYVNDVKKGFAAVKEENKKVDSFFQRGWNFVKFFGNKVVKPLVNVVFGVQNSKDAKKPTAAAKAPEVAQAPEVVKPEPSAVAPALPPVGEIPDALKGGGKPAEGQELPMSPLQARPNPPAAPPAPPAAEGNIPPAPPAPPVTGQVNSAPALNGNIPPAPPAPVVAAEQKANKESAAATKPSNAALLEEIQKGKDLKRVDTSKIAEKDAQRAKEAGAASAKEQQANTIADALAKRRLAIQDDEEANED